MKLAQVTLAAAFTLVSAWAYPQGVDAKWSSEEDNKQKLTLNNNLYIPIIIKVVFNNPSSFDANVVLPYTTTIPAKGSTSITLTPKNFGAPDYSYTYSYHWGCHNTQPNADFPYLIPVGKNKQTKVGSLYLVNEKYKMRTAVPIKNFYAIALSADKDDTVYATRRGTVFNLKENADLKHNKYETTTDENNIYVAHKDCTYGWYSVLSKIFVKEGQKVEAGDPIAIVGGDKYDRGNHVRFSVMYAHYCDTCSNREGTYGYAYVQPKFYLGNGVVDTLTSGKTYTASHSDEIIIQEMTKREVKKWRQAHPTENGK